MDLAELLLFAVAVAVFGIGYIFGRGNEADDARLKQELADKDQQLSDTLNEYQADLDRLIRTTEELQTTARERDQREAFIDHMRSNQAFEAWRRTTTFGDEPEPPTEEEIRGWLTCGLGLVEGRDFVVGPEFEAGKSPDFVRFHHDFSWVIEATNMGGAASLKARLKDIVESESSYLTAPILGRTNVGHMVVVSNPEATARGILPAGYEEYQSMFLAVHDLNGFAAADYAMRTLAARLASADTKVDPHHIELQANQVIRQGQIQIRAGQQLVMLGEAIRQNLTGTIPFKLINDGAFDETFDDGPYGDLSDEESIPWAPPHPVDGITTLRMEPLPSFNPMTSNPAPLVDTGEEEFNLAAAITRFKSYDDFDDEDFNEFDPDKELLDRLDEQEREAFSVTGGPVGPAARSGRDSGPNRHGSDRNQPPTWV